MSGIHEQFPLSCFWLFCGDYQKIFYLKIEPTPKVMKVLFSEIAEKILKGLRIKLFDWTSNDWSSLFMLV